MHKRSLIRATRLQALLIPFLASALLLGGSFDTAWGEVIFASAELGETGQTAGLAFDENNFNGARFSIDRPVHITAIGGHMGGSPYNGSIFGVIVPLEEPDAFPSVAPLELEQVALAVTVFDVRVPSADIRAPIDVFLEAGHYAVIFGSGLFGAENGRVIIPLGPAIAPTSLFFAGIGDPRPWVDAGCAGGNCFRFVVEGTWISTLNIDIKPDVSDSDSNSINIGSAGVIPVAIFSTNEFDATTINPESVSLAGASVKLVGKSGKYLCHQEDVNNDELIDLVCQVYTEQFLVEEGQTTAILEAETFDGLKVRGEDTITIVSDYL